MQVDEYLKACGMLETIDLADVAFVLDRRFSAHKVRSREWERRRAYEWIQFFGLHENSQVKWMTFWELAEFIARGERPFQIEPMVVLGKPCLTAGAFRTIERVVRAVSWRTRPFAPSARILETLRGRPLKDAWEQWRWISEDRLPPLRRTWTDGLRHFLEECGALLCLIYVVDATALLVCITGELCLSPLISVLALISLVVAISFGLRLCERSQDPLPPGFADFRDVARAMVAR